MKNVISRFEANTRNEFIEELQRSIKVMHKNSDKSLSLTQEQNLVARSLGYPAWNLLAEDIPSCGHEQFWKVLAAARFKGLVSEEVDDGPDIFDDYWFDASGD